MTERRRIELFLESDEYGREPFYAESRREATEMLWELYNDAMVSTEDDGIERKVGLIIPGSESEEI